MYVYSTRDLLHLLLTSYKRTMQKTITYTLCLTCLWSLLSLAAAAQTRVSGRITNESKREPLAGISIAVRGKVVGTITDQKGQFSLSVNTPPPFTLAITGVGFQTQEIVINGNRTDLDIALKEQVMLGQEVVVSASRVEENVLKSPVSIEKMDIRSIQSTAAPSFYDALRNLKGVEVSQQSVNFSSVNTRGFTSNGNNRLVQLVDGMDNQAPGLNFPVGNVAGISELDLESVELLPGAASALYGPNAINGLLLMTSKSPFTYQGLSAQARGGVMSATNRTTIDGTPQVNTPFYDVAFRYAKAFKNRLAFKVNANYVTAKDWQATDYRDQSFYNGYNPSTGTAQNNPGYNGVNVYGDENSSGVSLASFRPIFAQLLGVPASQLSVIDPSGRLAQLIGGVQQVSAQTGIPASQIVNDVLLPNTVVSRTGYPERGLVDYNTHSLKLNGAVHYRFNDKLEGILQANWGSGTTVYTSTDRYYINNFQLAQYKAELRGSDFFLRAYSTQERSGDAYAAGLLGSFILEAWKPSINQSNLLGSWYPQYAFTYAGGALQAFPRALQQALAANPGNVAAAYQSAVASINTLAPTLQAAALGVADAGKPAVGSAQFNQYADAIKQQPIAQGAKFLDRTNLYHAEGMYHLRSLVDPNLVDLTVGANYRMYALNSGGTLFLQKPEGGEYTIHEYGAYLQAIKSFKDVLKITGSVRYDKNQNFRGVFSPRISAVLTAAKDHNFRASYQTGFRIPTTQNQYINLNTPVALLIGGLPAVRDRYNLRDGRTTIFGTSTSYDFPEFKPERVLTFEVGYKGLIANRLLIDAYYYNSQMQNYIGAVVLSNPGVPVPIQTPRNYDKSITYQGFGLGIDYVLPKNFTIGGNLSNTTLNAGGVGLFDSKKNQNVLDDGFQIGFNTPKYRYNLSVANRNIGNSGWGFNVTWRYQDAFLWQELLQPVQSRTLANSQQIIIPAFSTLDAQVSKKIAPIKSILKVGGSNILRNQYTTGWGNPTIGAMYYVSLTFDELLN